MVISLKDDHFKALLDAGYLPYGNNKYAFIRYIECGKNIRYFHAIVDYYNRNMAIHIDTHKNQARNHSTCQVSHELDKEISRIKKKTLTYRLEQVQKKLIKRLRKQLCPVTIAKQNLIYQNKTVGQSSKQNMLSLAEGNK